MNESFRCRAALLAVALLGVTLPLMSSTMASARTIYVVRNTSNSVAVRDSLPWALHQANYVTKGFDRIRFDIPGDGPHEIRLTAPLYIVDQVDIDARTQPGYDGTPRVWLRGEGAVHTLVQFQDQASSVSGFQGFGLTHFTMNAITVMPTSMGNWLQYNWIGFRPTSAGVVRNRDTGLPGAPFANGVAIASSYNVVRYSTISGVYNGVVIGLGGGGKYLQNSVWESRIGTDPTGTTVTGYGNSSDGIYLGPGAESNWLGPNNVISGNASAGIELLHASNWGNVVFGNKIGLDATGRTRLGNGELGVLMSGGAYYNAIGGPFGGNYISGNTLGGVSIGTTEWGPGDLTWIVDNVIGLNVDGQVVGGQEVGVSVNSGSTRVAVFDNVIAGNDVHGVIVAGRTTKDNAVYNNVIGRDRAGNSRANGGFGLVFLNAGFNWGVDNVFGVNQLGSIGVSNSPNLVVN